MKLAEGRRYGWKDINIRVSEKENTKELTPLVTKPDEFDIAVSLSIKLSQLRGVEKVTPKTYKGSHTSGNLRNTA